MVPADLQERVFWWSCWRALSALAGAILKHKLGGDTRQPGP